MDTRNLVEAKALLEDTKGGQSDRSMQTVKLVEMGSVSVETKGFFRGVEVAFTPRS